MKQGVVDDTQCTILILFYTPLAFEHRGSAEYTASSESMFLKLQV